MDSKTQDILDLFKYTNSKDLKSMQTRLSKAAGTIRKDITQSRINAFYSDDELALLRKAAAILDGTKNKIEHAKEARAREEAERQLQFENQQNIRNENINKLFHFDDMNGVELFTLYLALRRFADPTNDLNHLVDHPNWYPNERQHWIRHIREDLLDLYMWDDMSEKVLTDFLDTYQTLRTEIEKKYKAAIERLKDFVMENVPAERAVFERILMSENLENKLVNKPDIDNSMDL